MSRLSSLVSRCVAMAAAAAVIAGCALLPTSESSSLKSRTASNDSDSPDDSSFFSWDAWKSSAKKLFGRGVNKELAKKLYREADDVFRQGLAGSQPDQRMRIFEMAAAKYAAAAERWLDSQLAMDALFMAGEACFFSDQYPQA